MEVAKEESERHDRWHLRVCVWSLRAPDSRRPCGATRPAAAAARPRRGSGQSRDPSPPPPRTVPAKREQRATAPQQSQLSDSEAKNRRLAKCTPIRPRTSKESEATTALLPTVGHTCPAPRRPAAQMERPPCGPVWEPDCVNHCCCAKNGTRRQNEPVLARLRGPRMHTASTPT